MQLLKLGDLYLEAARVEKGFTCETLRTDRTRIRAYCHWVGDQATLADLNPITLKRYFYHLVGRHQRPRTIKACINALRSFGAFLIEQDALPDNPARALPVPELDPPRREPQIVLRPGIRL